MAQAPLSRSFHNIFIIFVSTVLNVLVISVMHIHTILPFSLKIPKISALLTNCIPFSFVYPNFLLTTDFIMILFSVCVPKLFQNFHGNQRSWIGLFQPAWKIHSKWESLHWKRTSLGWAGPSSAIAGVEIQNSSKINFGIIGLQLVIWSFGKTERLVDFV